MSGGASILPSPTILAAIVAPLVAFALSRGMTSEEVTESSGICPEDVISPDARVSGLAAVKLWGALIRRAPDEPVTINYVKNAPLASIAGIAYSARYASDIRQVFKLIIRHQNYASDGHVLTLEEDGDLAHFYTSHVLDNWFLVPNEVFLGICWRMLTEVLDYDITARGVCIGRPPEGPTKAYEAFFGVPVDFGGGTYRLTIDRAVLDWPSKHRNKELAAFAEKFFTTALDREAERKKSQEFEALLNAIAQNATRGVYQISAIARAAAMSTRAAQRVASRNDTTLAALIRDVRFSRAKQLLSDTQVSLIEVAYLVGYSDDRAFRRAFKRSTGITPSEYRRGVE